MDLNTALLKAPRPAKRAVRSVRRIRRSAFERWGSDRYSAVAVGGMDRALAELLGRGGTFLEAGANDGVRYSNTYLLERFYGWRGVLVEAVPWLYRDCVRNRPAATVVHAALGRPGELEVRMADHDLLSYNSPTGTPIAARTLSSILEETGFVPDLMILDLEGYEDAVLEGLDFEHHAPEWLLLERQDASSLESTLATTLQHRYVMDRRLTEIDYLFRRT